MVSGWGQGSGVTYHQPILLTGGQVLVGEQPGGLQDADDALHVACQREAVMSQDQQLCGWVGWARVRQDCPLWLPSVSLCAWPEGDGAFWRRLSPQS